MQNCICKTSFWRNKLDSLEMIPWKFISISKQLVSGHLFSNFFKKLTIPLIIPFMYPGNSCLFAIIRYYTVRDIVPLHITAFFFLTGHNADLQNSLMTKQITKSCNSWCFQSSVPLFVSAFPLLRPFPGMCPLDNV